MTRAGLLALMVGSLGCDGELRFGDARVETGVDAGDASDAGADASSRCKTDVDCRPSTLHCDPTSGACVPCVSDLHCTTSELPRCDVASHRCVECGVPADCGGSETCDPKTRACLRTCGDGSSCGGGEAPICDPRGVCVCGPTTCTSGDRSICDPTGRCVECTSDAQCATDEPRCDVVRGRCVQCVANGDCRAPKPICDTSRGECVEG